jgi:hypothetical protein
MALPCRRRGFRGLLRWKTKIGGFTDEKGRNYRDAATQGHTIPEEEIKKLETLSEEELSKVAGGDDQWGFDKHYYKQVDNYKDAINCPMWDPMKTHEFAVGNRRCTMCANFVYETIGLIFKEQIICCNKQPI